MYVIKSNEDWLPKALDILQNGGCIAHATETCYGFACDLSNQKAVANIFKVKQRPEDMPISALFSSVEEAKKYVEWNSRAQELAEEELPGPLTLILPILNESSIQLFPTPSGSETIGIRVSPNAIALKLAQAWGKPLSTTSANLHGKPNPYRAEDILEQFEGQPNAPDLIIDSGNLPMNTPSTILNLSDGNESVLRP